VVQSYKLAITETCLKYDSIDTFLLPFRTAAATKEQQQVKDFNEKLAEGLGKLKFNFSTPQF